MILIRYQYTMPTHSWIHSFTGPIKLCTQSKVSKAPRGYHRLEEEDRRRVQKQQRAEEPGGVGADVRDWRS
jgi:hypothetical protein